MKYLRLVFHYNINSRSLFNSWFWRLEKSKVEGLHLKRALLAMSLQIRRVGGREGEEMRETDSKLNSF
jgi:hypothetical protein